MRIALLLVLLFALSLPVASRAADGPIKSKIQTFTMTPGPRLQGGPRVPVTAEKLPEPPPPAPPPPALPVEALLGRWTQGDPANCTDDRLVIEWTPEAQIMVAAGGQLAHLPVRYDAGLENLKIETLDAAGQPTGWWRLAPAAPEPVAERLRWVESAVIQPDGKAMIWALAKNFTHCPPAQPPKPSLWARLKGFVGL